MFANSAWRQVMPALALALCSALAAPALAAESLAPQPIADFYRAPDMGAAAMSPNGQFVAALVNTQRGRQELLLIDLAQREKSHFIAGFKNADITGVHWVNDDRLVYETFDLTYQDKSYFQGLFAVDRDSAESRQLVSNIDEGNVTGSNVKIRKLSPDWHFHAVPPGRTDDIIIEKRTSNSNQTRYSYSLARLDTKTLFLKPLTEGSPEGSSSWLLDNEGTPRVAISFVNGRERIHWRDSADAPWNLLGEFDDEQATTFQPHTLAPDGTLYVTYTAPGSSTSGLYRFDTKKRAVDPKPLISLQGFDFDGHFEMDVKTGHLLGLHYNSDARDTAWFDPKFRKIQEQVDKLLPGLNNRLGCGDCESSRYVLVTSSSDRQPTIYLVYDRTTERIDLLGKARPWIDARKMGRRDFQRFDARDGLSIPVYVTYPPASFKAPYPTVVMVHGGPYVRGAHWEWTPDAQFLASRGYAVIEPEFRGSEGFGEKHFKSGWKQWGLKMQDDVADASKWAVKQAIADPQRMCIAGASYGGYAALMGLAKDSDLFKCGVSWVGVTDIGLMYSIAWNDATENSLKYGMPRLVGDPEKDKAQLEATSPIRLAARIQRPLLMAYGGNDRRVPIEHGRAFMSAIKPYNKDVEYVEYLEEWHGWYKLETNVDFWGRVERFLAKQIGSERGSAAPAASSPP